MWRLVKSAEQRWPRAAGHITLDARQGAIAQHSRKERGCQFRQMRNRCFGDVARASRPLWHGHPARAFLRLVLAVDGPLFPVVKGDFMAAGAGRSRHSGRDARATNDQQDCTPRGERSIIIECKARPRECSSATVTARWRSEHKPGLSAPREVSSMLPDPIKRQRIRGLEELLEIEYEKLNDFQKDLAMTSSAPARFELRQLAAALPPRACSRLTVRRAHPPPAGSARTCGSAA
jgi:hypothetical protein